jgi:hypothetical protein
MTFVVNLKPVEKQLIFQSHAHRIALHPRQRSRSSLKTDTLRRNSFHIDFCFAFLLTPFTVSISLAA